MTSRVLAGQPVALRCPACDSEAVQYDSLPVSEVFRLVACGDCQMRFLDGGDREEETEFVEYWGESNVRIYAVPSVLAELADKYQKYLQILNAEAPVQTLLDVGSGIGLFVEQAAAAGFRASGVEPSTRAVAIARRDRGLNIHEGLLMREDSLPRDNGVVSLWDVIEHVHDPEALLIACRDHLVDGGLLILETPDEGAVLRKILRAVGRLTGNRQKIERNIYYPDHRYYFSRQAMARMLTRCGFDDIRFFRQHTMYRKTIEKFRHYRQASPLFLAACAAGFGGIRLLPLMGNKMVVICRKHESAGEMENRGPANKQ